MIPMGGGVNFSWPVAREKFTEGSLSHGNQFLTEHRYLLLGGATDVQLPFRSAQILVTLVNK